MRPEYNGFFQREKYFLPVMVGKGRQVSLVSTVSRIKRWWILVFRPEEDSVSSSMVEKKTNRPRH